jgi:hypothetical protein
MRDGTEQLGQDCRDRSVLDRGRPNRLAMTGQPGQDREDGWPGQNSKERTAVTGEPGTGVLGQGR